MQLTHLLVILSITLEPSLSQKLTPNAVKSLLQDILSPKNTEQAIQMISLAANKKRALPNGPGNINRRYVVTDNVPRNVVINEAPNRITKLVQIPQEVCTKNDVIVPNSNNVIVQNGKQMVLPKNIVVQRRTEAVLPEKVIIQNVAEVVPKTFIVRKNEAPKKVIVQSNDFAVRVPQMRAELVQQKSLVSSQIRPTEGQQKILIRQPTVTEYVNVPQQKVLVRNENPFLPAASPVSAVTASSSYALPPAIPQSRGQFLRKIPIPPPTL